MNPELIRLTAGFVAGFALLSAAPAIPGLLQHVALPAGVEQVEDALLCMAAGLSLGLLLLVMRRRQAARPPAVPAGHVSLATVENVWRSELRRAVEQGEPIPALARRYQLAQDAVRVAVGRGQSTPAAGAERVSPSRRRPLPVPDLVARPGTVGRRRSTYQAIG